MRYIKPGLNVSSVSSTEDIVAVFSKRMRVGSLYTIGLTEYPVNKEPLWYRFDINLSTTIPMYTTSTMQHGEFLSKTYYFPTVTSDVEDVNFNCFYPGKGPSGNANKLESNTCNGTTNCTNVVKNPGNDLYCNSTIGLKSTKNYEVKDCIDDLKKQSPTIK